MNLMICTPAIVYLVLSSVILFMGIKRIPRVTVIYEILTILSITFLANVFCLNGLSNIAWYLVGFFVLLPFCMAIVAVMPLIFAMISKKPKR
jgi:hydrogenase-4 membrane subunit HyfE